MTQGSGGPDSGGATPRISVANTVIAGVNKAGTTSLFVSLASHPDVFPASVKETRYFLPLRWGRTLEPVADYEHDFADARGEAVRLEATPSYFSGGAPLAREMARVCGPELRAIVVLREPVARCWSFFEYQKMRLRIPEEMTIRQYLDHAAELTDEDFRDSENERWSAERGGRYAEHLAAWHGVLGDRLHVVFFERLMSEPAATLREVAEFLQIDPDAYPSTELASENRTTSYKRAGLQRLALWLNDRFERFFRRHYALKERVRNLYYRVNGARTGDRMPPDVAEELAGRYREPNARLVAILDAMGIEGRPAWLADQYSSAE